MNLRSDDSGARRRMALGIATAVLFHLALAPLLPLLAPQAPQTPTKDRPIRVRALSQAQMKNIQEQKAKIKAEKAPEKEKKVEEEEKIKLDELEGQIVELPPSPSDEAPEDADYLSEYNTKVERESVSRHQSADFQAVMNERTRTKGPEEQSSAQQQSAALHLGQDPSADKEQANEESEASKGFAIPKLEFQQALALDEGPGGRLRNIESQEFMPGQGSELNLDLRKAKEEKGQKEGGASRVGPQQLELVPNIGVLANLTGGPMNDHIEDVGEGEGTFLNSREFKYASYFNRMKRGVSQHWQPMVEYRRRDPTGNIYGKRSRMTVLSIRLKADGHLEELQVSHSSGIEFLDNEALLAVQRAQPFPNPPRGLVDEETGMIEFPFSFHIDFNPRGGLRLPF